MEERRQHKRFPLDCSGINGKMPLASNIKILDISIGGLSIETERRLNIHNDYSLKIENNGKTLSIKGIIMWSVLVRGEEDEKGNIVPIYRAGMKFINVATQQIEEFINFIKEDMKHLKESIEIFPKKDIFIDLSEHFREELESFADDVTNLSQ